MADDQGKKSSIDDLIQELTQKSPSAPPQPPSSQPTPPPISRPNIPQNLPTSPTPPPVARPVAPPVPPRPVQPPVSPQPAAPVQPAQSAQPKEFQSSIRTMLDDINTLKQGQKPEGVSVQKTIETPKPPVAPPVQPTAPAAPRPTGVELGAAHKTAPLPTSSVPRSSNVTPESPKAVIPELPKSSSSPSVPSSIAIPPSSSGFPAKLVAFAVVLILLGAGIYWYFGIRDSEDIAEVTPTPEASATPQVLTLSDIYSGQNLASVSFEESDAAKFRDYVDSLPISFGDFRILKGSEKGLQELSMLDILDEFLVNYPSELGVSLDGDSITLIYGQRESFDNKGQFKNIDSPIGKLVFVSEVTDLAMASSSLSAWADSTMSADLAEILGHNASKPASTKFLQTNYNGIPVSYRNFMYPDKTIDYAVVQTNGRSYLVIASSRESVFAAIDRLLGSSR